MCALCCSFLAPDTLDSMWFLFRICGVKYVKDVEVMWQVQYVRGGLFRLSSFNPTHNGMMRKVTFFFFTDLKEIRYNLLLSKLTPLFMELSTRNDSICDTELHLTKLKDLSAVGLAFYPFLNITIIKNGVMLELAINKGFICLFYFTALLN